MDNHLKIINYLGKNLGKSYTMHELSKLLKIPYASFYRTIKSKKDLFSMLRVGTSIPITLDFSNTVVKSYLSISSEEEKKEYIENNLIIKKISGEIESKDVMLLFGSYAKGTQTKDSDIDLLIINKDGEKDLSFSKYELLYKKKINPIFITMSEFKAMLKDKDENLGKQALRNHIVLKKPEMFWEGVLDAI